jgi:hypothetical protein
MHDLVIPLPRMLLFVSLIRHLKRYLALDIPSLVTTPPTMLPDNVVLFLAQAIEVDAATINLAWGVWRDVIWESDNEPGMCDADRSQLVSIFLKYGSAYKLGT